MARMYDIDMGTYTDSSVVTHGQDILPDIMGNWGQRATTLPDGTFGFALFHSELRFWLIFAERQQEIVNAYDAADDSTKDAFDALELDEDDLINIQEVQAGFFGVE